jgi:hypothetical protein
MIVYEKDLFVTMLVDYEEKKRAAEGGPSRTGPIKISGEEAAKFQENLAKSGGFLDK